MRYIFLLIITLFALTCNTISNSIPLTNLKVLYEKDADIHGTIQKEAWSDIVCPADIEHYDPSQDTYNCVCMQQGGWEKIERLSDIKLHRPSLTNINFIWIKGEFTIDDDPAKYCGIYLEHVRGRDVIYINNRLAGIKHINNNSGVHIPSHYRIPSGILMKGKNIVHMRLEIISPSRISLVPYLYIQPAEDYDTTIFVNQIFYGWPKTVSLIIICVLFLYCTIHAFIDKHQKIYMLTSLFLLLYIALAILTSIPFKGVNALLFAQFLGTTPYIIAVFFIIFFQVFYQAWLPGVNKVLIPLILILLVLNHLFNDYFPLIIKFIVPYAIWLFFAATLGYVIYKVNRSKPDLIKLCIFSFMSIIFMAAFLFEILSYYIQRSWIPYNPYSLLYPVYEIFFSIYAILFGIRERKEKITELQELYAKFIAQKSRQSDGLTITDTSEDKLARVIEFINENYTRDLPRDVLAATINMNPNYFSSLFNSYTGRKIQEYINMLRIKEATKLIKETDNKIIDIAFSVGFENLGTFIRTFKKEMSKTPKEYRLENNIY